MPPGNSSSTTSLPLCTSGGGLGWIIPVTQFIRFQSCTYQTLMIYINTTQC